MPGTVQERSILQALNRKHAVTVPYVLTGTLSCRLRGNRKSHVLTPILQPQARVLVRTRRKTDAPTGAGVFLEKRLILNYSINELGSEVFLGDF